MKVKLNVTQEQKLTHAIRKENAYKEQFQISKNQYVEAMRGRSDIFEMIADKENIDVKKFDTQNYTVKDGFLILTEVAKDKATSRIKNALKKTINKNGHARSKAKN
jgi:hypothetical protein